ncbi:MAG: DEAD/DEAH box helicase, partial [Actinomycetota bacterium]|nr:DEAD/DEAH box helicase [Actinomycetota bacterium]
MPESPAADTIEQTITRIRAALQDYIEATYHISDAALVARRRVLLEQEGVLFRAPYIESTPRYKTSRRFADLDIPEAAKTLFAVMTSSSGAQLPLLHDPPYTHQADALEAAGGHGESAVITTGTGSGKTESFLLPLLAKLAAEASASPASFAMPAVRAILLYPMNALVNDQLGRLRTLFGDDRVTGQFTAWAGRPARFARYTSRTLYPGVRSVKKDQVRLKPIEHFYVSLLQQASGPDSPERDEARDLIANLQGRGKWPSKPDLLGWYGASRRRWQDPQTGQFLRAVLRPEDAELFTRHEVLDSPPDLLVTNYSMLEYMLMRPLERPVFDRTRDWLAATPGERLLLVVDEAHMYRGSAGAEVGLLLRRLRARLGIQANRLQVICAGASFTDTEYARVFAAQLAGKDPEDFRSVYGELALREGGAAGSAEDAHALAAVPMAAFYEAQDDRGRLEAVREFTDYRQAGRDTARPGEVLYEALHDFPPMSQLVNLTMRSAMPLSELGTRVFPGQDTALADQAVTALLALGSAARLSEHEAGLLPCRVHAFFRGLPGLWACPDPGCPAVPEGSSGGPAGALYS